MMEKKGVKNFLSMPPPLNQPDIDAINPAWWSDEGRVEEPLQFNATEFPLIGMIQTLVYSDGKIRRPAMWMDLESARWLLPQAEKFLESTHTPGQEYQGENDQLWIRVGFRYGSECTSIINRRKTALEKPGVYSIDLLENELRELVEFLRSQIQRTE